jgi:hypothetical protein
MSLPPYVSQGGEQVYAQPFLCENALFYGMILAADETAIQQNVCDKLLNIPSGQPGRFVPAGPFVLLALCELDKLVSETAPFSTFGGFTEQEVAFWVLTVDTAQDQVYFAFPYIWVDNAYALSMGREIYGFPKQLGKFEIPTDIANADHFSLQTLAITKLDPSSMGDWQPILEVNKTGPSGEIAEWGSAAEAVEKIVRGSDKLGGWAMDAELLIRLIADFIEKKVPFVFLKQFRDVADGTKACYQSVIECNCKLAAWHGGGLLDGVYEVTFQDVESEPIVKDLGLGPNPIVPGIAFWCKFDFYIGEGQEIWKA